MYAPMCFSDALSNLTLGFNQRGALACMEFTGNIVGYASSVVRAVNITFSVFHSTKPFTVDGLLLLIYRF